MSKNNIEEVIFIIRDKKVILDSDLAKLYRVETKVLNQAIKRNADRFPTDFMFQLRPEEVHNLRSQIVTSSYGGRRYIPYAFTEHGALMAANVLNSPEAIVMSVAIVRTFIKLRQIISSNKDLALRLDELEKRYDQHFQVVFQAIKQLMQPQEEIKKLPIGFH